MHTKYLEKIKYNLLKTRQAETYYYANVLFSMKTVWTEKIPTAGVDGKSFYINPVFLLALSMEEAIGVVAHEMNHVIRRHITDFHLFNRGVYDKEIEFRLWNEAGDHIINLDLLDAGYELPSFRLADPRFKGMATVQAYRILHDEYTDEPRDLMECMPCPIDGQGAEGDRQHTELETHINKVTIRAAVATQMAPNLDWGSMPGHLTRVIGEVENPKLDFSSILWNYMSQYKQEDYSYRRPNRRFIPDYYLPTLHSEGLCDLAFVFDLSGSVDDTTIALFYRALRVVKEQLNPDKITLIQFDTEIFKEDVITDLHDLNNLKFEGGGGTSIDPVLDWITEHKPEVTLIFTDGYFRPQSTLSGQDIIWIIQDNEGFTAPEGRVIHHNM